MSLETRIAVVVGLAVTLVIAVVFRFPALTTADVTSDTEASEANVQVLAESERDHCETSIEGINCRCFGDVSAVILADETPRVPSVTYADRSDLARGQAQRKC